MSQGLELAERVATDNCDDEDIPGQAEQLHRCSVALKVDTYPNERSQKQNGGRDAADYE